MDPSDLLGPILATGAAAALVTVLLVIGAALLGLWLVYTVIWRAVRRGLREYHEPQITAAVDRAHGPRDW